MGVNVQKVKSISENENFKTLKKLGIIGTELNFWIQIDLQNRKILNFDRVRYLRYLLRVLNDIYLKKQTISARFNRYPFFIFANTSDFIII